MSETIFSNALEATALERPSIRSPLNCTRVSVVGPGASLGDGIHRDGRGGATQRFGPISPDPTPSLLREPRHLAGVDFKAVLWNKTTGLKAFVQNREKRAAKTGGPGLGVQPREQDGLQHDVEAVLRPALVRAAEAEVEGLRGDDP